MATALATTDQKPGQKVVVATGAKLAAFIPQTLEEAWRLAGALAASGMTPKSYGSDQNKIMVGMMAGAEVGLTPMAALQSIAVIGNNPALWGDGALGLVQASGLLEDMEERLEGEKAICTLRRKGRASPIVGEFSMADAKKAGLAGKAGPWTQYPSRMLKMRARAFALRDGFADVLRGLHIAEEARDYAPMVDGGALGAAQPITAAALLEQAKPEPEAEEATPEPEGPADAQFGEAYTGAGEEVADEIIGFIDRKETVIDVNSLVSSRSADIAAMSEENRHRVAEAQSQRIADLKARR